MFGAQPVRPSTLFFRHYGEDDQRCFAVQSKGKRLEIRTNDKW